MLDHHCPKLLGYAKEDFLSLDQTEASKEGQERLRLVVHLRLIKKVDQRTQSVYGLFPLLKYL